MGKSFLNMLARWKSEGDHPAKGETHAQMRAWPFLEWHVILFNSRVQRNEKWGWGAQWGLTHMLGPISLVKVFEFYPESSAGHSRILSSLSKGTLTYLCFGKIKVARLGRKEEASCCCYYTNKTEWQPEVRELQLRKRRTRRSTELAYPSTAQIVSYFPLLELKLWGASVGPRLVVLPERRESEEQGHVMLLPSLG